MVISYHLFPPQTGEGESRVFLEKNQRLQEKEFRAIVEFGSGEHVGLETVKKQMRVTTPPKAVQKYSKYQLVYTDLYLHSPLIG